MSTAITLPLWVFVALLALAAWAALERLLLPSLRWYLRRRVNRIIDELNTRLQLRIEPFRLTKRQVLIERLTYDTEVVEAAHAYAEREEISQTVVRLALDERKSVHWEIGEAEGSSESLSDQLLTGKP